MFQRFRTPTSANITYTGPNQAIGPDAIQNVVNFGKFLKNNNGTSEWVSIDLPQYTLPFLSFESSKKWMFAFGNRFATYVPPSNLLTNLPPYGPGTAPTSIGANISLHAADNRACQTNNNTASSWVLINNGSPSTERFCIAFLLKPLPLSAGSFGSLCRVIDPLNVIQNPIICGLSKPTSTTWEIYFRYWQNTTLNQSRHVTTVLNTTQFLENTVYLITFSLFNGSAHIRINGVEQTYTQQTVYQPSITPGNLVLFSATPDTSLPQFVPSCATYCSLMVDGNMTQSIVEKIEGCIKWDPTYSDIVPALPPSHPYSTIAPTL